MRRRDGGDVFASLAFCVDPHDPGDPVQVATSERLFLFFWDARTGSKPLVCPHCSEHLRSSLAFHPGDHDGIQLFGR